MQINLSHPPISPDDYLHAEQLGETKHQLIDGEIFAMAGASEIHNLLSLNLASELKNQLKGKPYRTFIADMKVRVADDFYYPDVMVVCTEDKAHDYYKTSPIIIVEVLSKATRKFDQTSKRLRCQNIPTLEEYVLIEQDKGEIQVFRKQQHWQSSYLLLSRRRHHLYLARHYAIRRRLLRSGRQRRCVGFLNSRASLKLLYHSIYGCLMP